MARKPAPPRKPPPPGFEEHPLYGLIPYRFPSYDLEFQPELPPGAVRGDPALQRGYCSHCEPPRYFYVDVQPRCRECGVTFVWEADTQRHWFEVLKFPITSDPPSRCADCRRELRVARGIRRRLVLATAALEERPDDAEALLEFAAATAEQGMKVGSGDLSPGIAAARKAVRLDPGAHTALLWEAVIHDAEGRTETAVACYREFAYAARKRRGLRKLVGRAHQRISDLAAEATDEATSGFS